ncbi:hypothetical protein BDV95DRAFT_480417, partial [Massariosphaeria phaeospora]
MSVENTAGSAEIYECAFCLDEFPSSEGISAACPQHFICNACALSSFEHAVADITTFPASCCANVVWPPALFEDIIPPALFQTYTTRLREYNTVPTLRVYCANTDCGVFLHRSTFDNSNPAFSIARCPRCRTTTCVGCNSTWLNEWHRCEEDNFDPHVTPDWLPPYTNECRIKRCPRCRAWLEHGEACNHMTCAQCSHQFCFVCLLEFIGGHEEDGGCPMYGEPGDGYDEEGYEIGRGLHRLTGRDRQGRN